MAKQKVGLLFGGCSGEHEVSISSARAILEFAIGKGVLKAFISFDSNGN